MLRTYRLMAAAREAERIRERLAAVRCPVRLLIGRVPPSKGVPPDELAVMRSGLARLELETVATAGHFIAEEAPEAIVRGVDALLRETAGTGNAR